MRANQRATTLIAITIITLIASAAWARSYRRASRNAGFAKQRRALKVVPRAHARFAAVRNSAFGDFRQQLKPPDRKIWDGLKPGEKADVLRDFAAQGAVKWTDALNGLEEAGKAGPFEASAFSRAPGRYTFLGKDKGHQRSKFTVVRELSSRMVIDLGQVPTDREGDPIFTKAELADPRKIDHSVSVATPNGKQPVWLHQVDSKGAGHLGRMVRDALSTLPRVHGVKWGTKAYINMPGVISIPRLHAHGVWRGKQAQVSDWDGFVKSNRYAKVSGQQGDFQVYQAPARVRGDAKRLPIIAVADPRYGGTNAISGKTDALLGQMILSVKDAALKANLPGALARGRIEIDSTDKRLVVRLYERPARQISE